MDTMLIEADPVPLRADADGVVRVGETRVSLDTVVTAFQLGATPESIVEQYPSLNLDDVYSVVGYMLRHRDRVQSYMEQRSAQRDAVRRDNEARFPPMGIRDRLLARRKN
jgi:uncharacterized protein (DUF433 family)